MFRSHYSVWSPGSFSPFLFVSRENTNYHQKIKEKTLITETISKPWRWEPRCLGSRSTPTPRRARGSRGAWRWRRSPPRTRKAVRRRTERTDTFCRGARTAGPTSTTSATSISGAGLVASVRSSMASLPKPSLNTLTLSPALRWLPRSSISSFLVRIIWISQTLFSFLVIFLEFGSRITCPIILHWPDLL